MLVLTIEEDDLVDVYTVEDMIDEMGCGVFQIFLSLLAGGMWVSNNSMYCLKFL